MGVNSIAAGLAAIHRELGIPSSYAVNRGLVPHAEADESMLVDLGPNPDGRPVRLVPPAAEAFRRMRSAALEAGIELTPISGFRSVARQTEIIRTKLAAGQPMEAILRLVAAPGFSEHHTGRALDLGSPEHIELDEEFATTRAYRWLHQHATHHGFRLSYPGGNTHGIGYEPWHWCWHP